MMSANAACLRQTYGEAFYRSFRAAADDKLMELMIAVNLSFSCSPRPLLDARAD